MYEKHEGRPRCRIFRPATAQPHRGADWDEWDEQHETGSIQVTRECEDEEGSEEKEEEQDADGGQQGAEEPKKNKNPTQSTKVVPKATPKWLKWGLKKWLQESKSFKSQKMKSNENMHIL